jgi:hypothetical protein
MTKKVLGEYSSTTSIAWTLLMRTAVTISVALASLDAVAESGSDPLQHLKGVYEGTLRWPLEQDVGPPQRLIEPVMRGEEAKFVLALDRTSSGAKLRYAFDDEAFEAWIVGTVGETTYVAPEGAGNHCRPLREFGKPRSSAPTLWLACEPMENTGLSPAVLIELTITFESPAGTARQLALRFREYGRKDRMPRPDARTEPALEGMPQEERAMRILWRDGTGLLQRQSE